MNARGLLSVLFHAEKALDLVQTARELDLPRGYDVLSFIRVLHDWPAETTRLLLAKATEVLPPGGRIVICEEFRTLDRLATQFFWTYFLTGVDTCVSRLREIEWYTDALRSLGFAEIHIVRGSFDLVTAIRP